MINTVISGRIVKDAQAFETKQGREGKMVKFSVACDSYGGETQFFDCGYFQKSESKLPEYLTKGRYVTVSGEVSLYRKADYAALNLKVSNLDLGPKQTPKTY